MSTDPIDLVSLPTQARPVRDACITDAWLAEHDTALVESIAAGFDRRAEVARELGDTDRGLRDLDAVLMQQSAARFVREHATDRPSAAAAALATPDGTPGHPRSVLDWLDDVYPLWWDQDITEMPSGLVGAAWDRRRHPGVIATDPVYRPSPQQVHTLAAATGVPAEALIERIHGDSPDPSARCCVTGYVSRDQRHDSDCTRPAPGGTDSAQTCARCGDAIWPNERVYPTDLGVLCAICWTTSPLTRPATSPTGDPTDA